MSAKPKVNVIVPIEADLQAQVEAVADVRYIDWSVARADLLAAMQDVEGVLLTPRVRGDAEFFDASPKLRVLSTTSVGYDAFNIDEATKHGVVVCHTPGVLTNAVANLTVALILNLALKLRENEAYVRDGNWAANATRPGLGIDIQGKTLGVVGFGRIGQTVTRFVQALGMKTIWYDVFDTPHPSAPKSEYRPLDALLAEADFVTLHTNLDATTRHFIGAAELAKMKRTAFLVNTARGGLVDQVALTEALRALRARGLKILMLTGDHALTAMAVAHPLGLKHAEASVAPADKQARVTQLRAAGKIVAMVGDGINDAPALAAADVGIAMGTGTDVAIESAGLSLLHGDLRGLVRAVALSHAVMRNIRQNLVFAFLYNALGIPIAAGLLYPWLGILLSPMLAGAAMCLSSVSVIANALRLRTVRLD